MNLCQKNTQINQKLLSIHDLNLNKIKISAKKFKIMKEKAVISGEIDEPLFVEDMFSEEAIELIFARKSNMFEKFQQKLLFSLEFKIKE